MNETAHIQIRLAQLHEASVISDLLDLAFAAYRPQYTTMAYDRTVISAADVVQRMQVGILWVAEYDGVLVGTAAIDRRLGSLYIQGMAVHPHYQGLGIAYRLLQTIETHALCEGYPKMDLLTTAVLQRAVALYERFGFKQTPNGAVDFFGTPAFAMEKWLAPIDRSDTARSAHSEGDGQGML